MKLDPLARVHLKWMFENQPELVGELLWSNKLESHLEDKLDQALLSEERLLKQGVRARSGLHRF